MAAGKRFDEVALDLDGLFICSCCYFLPVLPGAEQGNEGIGAILVVAMGAG
jgi:hypothetical protein